MTTIEHQIEEMGRELADMLDGAKSAVERINRLTTEPHSVRRYQPRYMKRPNSRWDSAYNFLLAESDDRDRPYELAMHSSEQGLAGERSTFRHYADAETAGREWCETHGKSLDSLVIASLDIVHHNVEQE